MGGSMEVLAEVCWAGGSLGQAGLDLSAALHTGIQYLFTILDFLPETPWTYTRRIAYVYLRRPLGD